MSASKKDCRARADNGKDPIKSELFDPVPQFGDSAHRSSFPSIISKETATRSYQRNFFQKTTVDLPLSRGARKAVTFSSVRVRAAASRGAFCRFCSWRAIEKWHNLCGQRSRATCCRCSEENDCF
jgi:hypothetical protein